MVGDSGDPRHGAAGDADPVGDGVRPGDGSTTARRRGIALAVVLFCVFTTAVDVTITNVAVPFIATDLGATTGQLQWIVDSYNIVLAGLLLFGGGLADRFGRRPVFLSGYALFGVGCLVAATAGDPSTLIAGRVVMGVGAAMVITPALAIVADLYPPEERGGAIAIWAVVGAVGTAVGPVLGGLLLNEFWWGSVFLVNVPVVVVGVVLGLFVLPNSRKPGVVRLDPLGALLSVLGLGILLFGVIEGPDRGWTAPEVVGALVLGAVGVGLFVWWEARTEFPMFDVRVLTRRVVATGGVALLLTYVLFTGMLFLVPQYLQFVEQESIVATGLALVPFAVAFGVVSHWVGPLSSRLGQRGTLTAGLALLALSAVELAVFRGTVAVVVGTVLVGVGCGLLITPASTVVMNDLPAEKASEGSGVNMVSRFVGAAAGVAVIGTVFSSFYGRSLRAGAPSGVAPDRLAEAEGSVQAALTQAADTGGSIGDELAAAARDAFSSGMTAAFAAAAVLAVAATLLAWVVLGRRPAD